MGPYLYFRVLIFTVLASLTQRMSIQSACIQQWFRFKLFSNFYFYLCLCINFHTGSFRVLIFAASGPYWVLISQKNGPLLGLYLKAWGSLLVLEAVLSGVVKLHHIKEVVNVPFWQWGGERLILHWGWCTSGVVNVWGGERLGW